MLEMPMALILHKTIIAINNGDRNLLLSQIKTCAVLFQLDYGKLLREFDTFRAEYAAEKEDNF